MKTVDVFGLLCVATMLFLILVLTACGRGVVFPEADQGEARPYVEKFEQAAKTAGNDLHGASFSTPIVFQDGPQAKPRCWTNLLGEKSVQISRKSWALLNDTLRLMTLFHELGHCVLGRDHRNEERDGRPVSLMNANRFPGEGAFHAHETEYVAELFASQ